MTDRGVSQHALDILLGDGNEVADDDREHRQEHDHRAPGFVQSAEAVDQNSENQREGSQLGCRSQVQSHGGSSTLIHVRQPHVERHRAELERNADDQERQTKPERQVVEAGIS